MSFLLSKQSCFSLLQYFASTHLHAHVVPLFLCKVRHITELDTRLQKTFVAFSQSESDTSQSEDLDVWKEDDQDDNIFSDLGWYDVDCVMSLEFAVVGWGAQKVMFSKEIIN